MTGAPLLSSDTVVAFLRDRGVARRLRRQGARVGWWRVECRVPRRNRLPVGSGEPGVATTAGAVRVEAKRERTLRGAASLAICDRELQRVHPQVTSALGTCIDDLTTSRECLVHGDFSPKNLVVGHDLCWMIDAEVAGVGAPVLEATEEPVLINPWRKVGG